MASGENKVLESWALRISFLTALIVPTITATGAYYKLDGKIDSREAAVIQRVQTLELDSTRHFADKDELKEMHQEIKQLRSDVTEIKTLLKRSR